MNALINKAIDEWINPPYNTDNINQIKQLIKEKNYKELEDRFYTKLHFGTGGIRGIIGAGTNRMNIYTIGIVTQGVANYIILNKLQSKGIVIARDSRNMSLEFAKETASIFAGNGIKVYYFNDITPVPIASFAIRTLNTIGGVVITASHNPAEYNGYKLYWQDGAQLTNPKQKEICQEIDKIDTINEIKKIDFYLGVNKGSIKFIGDEIVNEYMVKLNYPGLFNINKKKTIKIIYTPLHGTGYKIIPKILNHFGFDNIYINKKQIVPDGNFPTVKYPNPEEKESFDESIKLAKEKKADIIIANDPDADRMGAGIKNKNGEYVLLNGNQIAVILGYYILQRMKENKILPKNGIIIKTIVTTDLLKKIAESFGCELIDVLIGFKWIASKINQYEETGSKIFLFGCEEGYGYLTNNLCRDKDGIGACCYFAEIAEWLSSKNLTFTDFINEIYIKYGLFSEEVFSYTLSGKDGEKLIVKIMNTLRNESLQEIDDYKINKIYDYKTSLIKNIQESTIEKISDLPSADIIQFYLENNSKITVRPSGTEPKIKFYFSSQEEVNKNNIEKKESELKERNNKFKNALIKKINKLLDIDLDNQ